MARHKTEGAAQKGQRGAGEAMNTVTDLGSRGRGGGELSLASMEAQGDVGQGDVRMFSHRRLIFSGLCVRVSHGKEVRVMHGACDMGAPRLDVAELSK